MKEDQEHFRPFINFETGYTDMAPETVEQRRARLLGERAAQKAAAFSNRFGIDEARSEALTEAWRRVYEGAAMPIHYDLVLTSKGFTKRERYTLVDAAFTSNVFDPSQLVGSKGAMKLKRSRPKTVPAHFVHRIALR